MKNKSIILSFVIICFCFSFSARAYDFGNVTLKNGSRGEAVMELQRFLNDNLNLGLVIDGKLGPKTIGVIKIWQQNNGLVADGLIGAKTKAKMNSMLPSPVLSSDNQENNSDLLIEKELIKGVFDKQIKTCKEDNMKEYASYFYYGDKLFKKTTKFIKELELEIKNTDNKETKDMIKRILSIIGLPNYCKNIKYTFGDITIKDNNATLIVNATINGLKKAPKTIFYIKDNNIWKENTFGYNHPADAVGVDVNQCQKVCENKGLFESGNILDEETNECFCLYDTPHTEDLSNLNIIECEARPKTFRDSCYTSRATSKDHCKKVSIENRITCYEDFALYSKDATVCENIWEDNTCLENIQKTGFQY